MLVVRHVAIRARSPTGDGPAARARLGGASASVRSPGASSPCIAPVWECSWPSTWPSSCTRTVFRSIRPAAGDPARAVPFGENSAESDGVGSTNHPQPAASRSRRIVSPSASASFAPGRSTITTATVSSARVSAPARVQIARAASSMAAASTSLSSSAATGCGAACVAISATSLSRIVTVALPSAIVAPDAADNDTMKDSVCSLTLSPTILTWKLSWTTPGLNVSTVDADWKSRPRPRCRLASTR